MRNPSPPSTLRVLCVILVALSARIGAAPSSIYDSSFDAQEELVGLDPYEDAYRSAADGQAVIHGESSNTGWIDPRLNGGRMLDVRVSRLSFIHKS